MRFVFLIPVLFLVMFLVMATGFPGAVAAADGPPSSRSSAPLPPPTAGQIDEALNIFDECTASKAAMRRYDCECVGMRFLDLRRQKGSLVPDYDLRVQSRKDCPNTPGVAGEMYERCLAWAPRERSDYEQFCTCYANKYATIFSKNPTDSLRIQEGQMTAALSSCNAGWVTDERLGRRDMVKQLKERGLYNLLFPGAEEFNPRKKREEERARRLRQILNQDAP